MSCNHGLEYKKGFYCIECKNVPPVGAHTHWSNTRDLKEADVAIDALIKRIEDLETKLAIITAGFSQAQFYKDPYGGLPR